MKNKTIFLMFLYGSISHTMRYDGDYPDYDYRYYNIPVYSEYPDKEAAIHRDQVNAPEYPDETPYLDLVIYHPHLDASALLPVVGKEPESMMSPADPSLMDKKRASHSKIPSEKKARANRTQEPIFYECIAPDCQPLLTERTPSGAKYSSTSLANVKLHVIRHLWKIVDAHAEKGCKFSRGLLANICESRCPICLYPWGSKNIGRKKHVFDHYEELQNKTSEYIRIVSEPSSIEPTLLARDEKAPRLDFSQLKVIKVDQIADDVKKREDQYICLIENCIIKNAKSHSSGGRFSTTGINCMTTHVKNHGTIVNRPVPLPSLCGICKKPITSLTTYKQHLFKHDPEQVNLEKFYLETKKFK